MSAILRFINKIIDERDLSVDLYRCLSFAVVIILIIVVIHFTVASVIVDKSNGLSQNKWFVLNKTAWNKPLSNVFKPKILSSVAYEYYDWNLVGMLAAESGDTVYINNGQFYKNNILIPELSFVVETPVEPDYSPRDNLESFVVPKIGDRIVYTNDDISAVCFLYNLMKQEENVNLTVKLISNGIEKSNFFIEDFVLFSGMFSDIPDDLKSSKFFWNAFLEWYKENVSSNVILNAEILNENGEIVTGWQVGSNFYFISVNKQDGFDSRYTGAISENKIIGTIGIKIPSMEDLYDKF